MSEVEVVTATVDLDEVVRYRGMHIMWCTVSAMHLSLCVPHAGKISWSLLSDVMVATRLQSHKSQYGLALLVASDVQHLGVADVVLITKDTTPFALTSGSSHC